MAGPLIKFNMEMSWRRGKYKKHREREGERASGIWYLFKNKDILYCLPEHTVHCTVPQYFRMFIYKKFRPEFQCRIFYI
jgi:hypothetical protein